MRCGTRGAKVDLKPSPFANCYGNTLRIQLGAEVDTTYTGRVSNLTKSSLVTYKKRLIRLHVIP